MKKLVLALVALAATVAVATPALADYNFYGSMRLKTLYTHLANTPLRNTDDTALAMQGNSRFGANATTGDLGGKVEIGLSTEAGTLGSAYLRLLYGTWKTDAGTLLIGQSYAPYWTGYAHVYLNDDASTGYGNLYEGRTPMIKFDTTSGLYFAALQNKAGAETKYMLPKLNVGFKNKAGDLSYNLGFAYQQYEQYYADATFAAAGDADFKRNIISYLGYFEVGMKQEAMAFTGKLHYGRNLKEFGFTKRTLAYDAANKDNVEAYGGVVQVSASGANVGFSYTLEDRHAGKTNKDVFAFVNYVIQPAKGFSITPEVFVFDRNVKGFDWDEFDEVAATIKWQMDF